MMFQGTLNIIFRLLYSPACMFVTWAERRTLDIGIWDWQHAYRLLLSAASAPQTSVTRGFLQRTAHATEIMLTSIFFPLPTQPFQHFQHFQPPGNLLNLVTTNFTSLSQRVRGRKKERSLRPAVVGVEGFDRRFPGCVLACWIRCYFGYKAERSANGRLRGFKS